MLAARALVFAACAFACIGAASGLGCESAEPERTADEAGVYVSRGGTTNDAAVADAAEDVECRPGGIVCNGICFRDVEALSSCRQSPTCGSCCEGCRGDQWCVAPPRKIDPYGTQEKHCVTWCDFGGGIVGAICPDASGVGQCVDLHRDARNCGACGFVCGANQACVDAGCQ